MFLQVFSIMAAIMIIRLAIIIMVASRIMIADRPPRGDLVGTMIIAG